MHGHVHTAVQNMASEDEKAANDTGEDDEDEIE